MQMNKPHHFEEQLFLTHWCRIRDFKTASESNPDIFHESFLTFADYIKALYKSFNPGYAKFYKMDNLSKLGFMAAEIVLNNSRAGDWYKKERIGVFLANSSSSLDTDTGFQKTISNKSDYFPSPAVFVYTLANIVIGEICIRNGIKGENAFFISEAFDPSLLVNNITALLAQGQTDACIGGWVELFKETHDAFVFLVQKRTFLEKQQAGIGISIAFNEENLLKSYSNQ
jgi:hypothetical protein